MKAVTLSVCLLCHFSLAFGQFSLLTNDIRGLREGDATWTDLDSDGDIDLIVFGNDIDANGHSVFYRNEDGIFSEFDILNFPELFDGALDWADFNNDGAMDIAIIGFSIANEGVITKIFTYSDGSFIDTGIVLPGVTRGSIDWGDYNNDGAVDLLIVGQDSESKSVTKLFKNIGTDFEEVAISGVEGVSFGDAAWADFDGDGLLDFIVTGVTGTAPDTGPPITRLYHNSGTGFEDTGFEFTGVYNSSVEWADADSDGDLDLLLTGFTGSFDAITQLYLNEGSGFQLSEIQLPGIIEGFAKWGDYNRDGLMDILIVGNSLGGSKIFKVFKNNNLDFEEVFSDSGVGQASGGWADFNNDGYLDIFINGQDDNFDLTASIYVNDASDEGGRKNSTNFPPDVPLNLNASTSGNSVWLSWDKSLDDFTNQESISYSVVIKKDGNIVISSLSLETGERLLVERGNAGFVSTFIANNLLPGDYEWAVQAIDNSFLASTFTEPQFFSIDGVVVGLDEGHNEKLNIFPNPFLDYISFDDSHFGEHFILLDSKGSKIKEGMISDSTLYLGYLPSGMFLLKVAAGKRVLSKRLIKR